MGFWKRKGKSARKGSRAAAGSIQKRREIAEPLEPRYLLSTLPFTFNLATPASTSAGVYNSAGTLVRTLWSGPTAVRAGLAGRRATMGPMLTGGTPCPPSRSRT